MFFVFFEAIIWEFPVFKSYFSLIRDEKIEPFQGQQNVHS